LALLPWPRALAAQIWSRWVAARVTVVQSPEHVSDELAAVFAMNPGPWEEVPVQDLAEAERLAGFRPLLPSSDVVAGSVHLSVVQHIELSTSPLDVPTIERALETAGVADVRVPPEWQGLTLTATGGPVVVLNYDGLAIMQLPPLEMTASARVHFGEFMAMAFRVFGRTSPEAHELGQKFEANPALVLHFPRETPVRELALASGEGILVPRPDGSDGVCFFWSLPDRIFIVDADELSDAQAVALANTMR
jgi:hypothetical protein